MWKAYARLLFLSLTLGAWSSARALPVYFVVTEIESFHGDSYVLPLEEPEDIHHARDLIARGPEAGATIALARIAQGADGVNRDVLAPGEPSWSWHIEGFLGFTDFAIEIFDGWPTFVEDDVRGWIDNTGGIIGFWQYTVTAELKSVREPGTAALLSVMLLVLGALTNRIARDRTAPANPVGGVRRTACYPLAFRVHVRGLRIS